MDKHAFEMVKIFKSKFKECCTKNEKSSQKRHSRLNAWTSLDVFKVSYTLFKGCGLTLKLFETINCRRTVINKFYFSGGEIMKAKSKAGKVRIVGTDEPVTFEKLESMECPDDWRETIEKDLHRQFPDHEMFRKKGTGKQDLFRVLKAWVLYNPQVGYCQGQAPVASLLVMNMTGTV